MKIIKLWLPLALWAGLIFYLSGIPDLKTGLELDLILRKTAHICEYFILTWLLYRAFKGSFTLLSGQLFIFPPALALLYAGSDEFHQLFIAGRRCCWQDVLIDALGIAGFYAVLMILPAGPGKLKTFR